MIPPAEARVAIPKTLRFSPTIGTAVYINSGGDLRLRVRQALSGIVVSENLPGSIALNRWQHIAVSYDGTSIRVFIEGKLLKTVSYNTQSSTDSTQDFSIGFTILRKMVWRTIQ